MTSAGSTSAWYGASAVKTVVLCPFQVLDTSPSKDIFSRTEQRKNGMSRTEQAGPQMRSGLELHFASTGAAKASKRTNAFASISIFGVAITLRKMVHVTMLMLML